MDIMPAWMGGLLIGIGISGFAVFLNHREIWIAMLFFVIFIIGVAGTYWADSAEWSRATSRDQPQKPGTA